MDPIAYHTPLIRQRDPGNVRKAMLYGLLLASIYESDFDANYFTSWAALETLEASGASGQFDMKL